MGGWAPRQRVVACSERFTIRPNAGVFAGPRHREDDAARGGELQVSAPVAALVTQVDATPEPSYLGDQLFLASQASMRSSSSLMRSSKSPAVARIMTSVPA